MTPLWWEQVCRNVEKKELQGAWEDGFAVSLLKDSCVKCSWQVFFFFLPSLSPRLSARQQMRPFPFLSVSHAAIMSCSGSVLRQILFSLIDHLWWWQRYQSDGIWISRCRSLLNLSVSFLLSFPRLPSASRGTSTVVQILWRQKWVPVLILRLIKIWMYNHYCDLAATGTLVLTKWKKQNVFSVSTIITMVGSVSKHVNSNNLLMYLFSLSQVNICNFFEFWVWGFLFFQPGCCHIKYMHWILNKKSK